MRISSKGQVTIPKRVREEAGLLPQTEVRFIVEAEGVRIVRVPTPSGAARGAIAVERLRRNAGRIRATTDEIMALTRDPA